MKALAHTLFMFCWLCLSSSAAAWGPTGHSATGVLAVERLQAETRETLADILGSTDLDTVASACYWPDLWRGMGDGADETRLHFVNIDPDANAYSRRRDCPDQQCVTEAVNRQAAILADPQRSTEERRLAFKGLCHFAGDLHTPLHVGYADDQGGNLITIRFRGSSMNLHRYWDSGLLKSQVKTLSELLDLLRERPDQAPDGWEPADTYSWTNETFAVTRNFAYPPVRTIDAGFEKRSWQVILQQLDAGSGRLAAILETTLGSAKDEDPEASVGQNH